MRTLKALLALLTLLACKNDESISAFVAPNAVWHLASMNGEPFAARATITFPEPGQITGQAPCNNFSATQTVPYPWFKVEAILSTRAACPDLPLEQAFFAALSNVAFAEVSGDTLILTDETGAEMVFTNP